MKRSERATLRPPSTGDITPLTHPANAADIVAIVDSFPPLTAEDCERLAPLWRPGAEVMWRTIREREAAARRKAHGGERAR